MARTFTPDRASAAMTLHRNIESAGQIDVALWLSAYTGDNPFLLSVREGMRRFGRLTPAQESSVRRNMENARARQDAAPTPPDAGKVTPAIPDGTYTIVNAATGGYRTIELSTADPAKFTRKRIRPGTQIAAYHSGPDNDTDFTGFAWVQGTVIEPFAKHAAPDAMRDWKTALRFLLTGRVSSADAAHAYALKSGRCARCQRTLTVPASLHRGYGPECVKKAAGEARALPTVVRERQPDEEAVQLPPARPAGRRTYSDLFPEDD